MKILNLTLKKKWFDMIASGEKKEEYREIKPYWIKRLEAKKSALLVTSFEKFDKIIFKNGYGKNVPTMEVECLGIEFGESKEKWSDQFNFCYVIMLGKVISIKH